MTTLQEMGNSASSAKQYRNAIEFYSRALQEGPATDNVAAEFKCTILASRAEAHVRSGSFYDALADCDRALTSDLTRASDVLVAKLHLQRAEVRRVLGMYEDASVDYEIFDQLRAGCGSPVTEQHKRVLRQIEHGLEIPEGSYEMDRVKLIRAVQARGLLIGPNYRKSFPRDPNMNAAAAAARYADEEETGFLDGTPAPHDYLDAPLNVLFSLAAPFLADPIRPTISFTLRGTIPEYMSLGEIVQMNFTSVVVDGGVRTSANERWFTKAVEYESPEKSRLLVVTRRGRVLEVPWKTKIADIWAGARWPRDGHAPFKVVRCPAVTWADEVDGIEFLEGFTIPVYVVLNDDVPKMVKVMDDIEQTRMSP